MNGITFWYIISLAIQKRLSMQLMDAVTAYLYGSLDSDIYMKVPDGISIPNANANRNMYCVKLKRLLYGLKQSWRIWYNSWVSTLFTKVIPTMMIARASSSKDPLHDFALYLCM
jgi:hypothetical protein